MKIELSCAKCGGDRFNYPVVLTNDSLINCADCGHQVGTVTQLQQKLVQQLAATGSSKST